MLNANAQTPAPRSKRWASLCRGLLSATVVVALLAGCGSPQDDGLDTEPPGSVLPAPEPPASQPPAGSAPSAGGAPETGNQDEVPEGGLLNPDDGK